MKYEDKQKCEHEWELSHTSWEYPDGATSCGTINREEYAYLLCNKCVTVIKRKISNE